MSSLAREYNLPSPKPAKCVMFDMDGLLIDSEHYYTVAFNNVVSRYGKEFTWPLKVKIMGTKAAVYSRMIVDDLSLPITPEEFIEMVEQEYPKLFPLVKMMPGVERTLHHLHSHKVPMAIASSSRKDSFEQKTSHFGTQWRSLFHHFVLASDDPEVKNSKPAPDTFLVCRSRFDPPLPAPEECIVFEDSVSGVLAGCRAGCQVVWIPDARLDVASYLKKEPELRPCLILESMEQLKPELFHLPPFAS